MGLIGKKAPEISACAVVDGKKVVQQFSLQDLQGKYVVLFFYPLDFTFVCPTELHAFQDKYDEFKKLGAELIGCSRDSQFSHLAWLNTPKNKSGIQGITYPLLADMNLEIARSYGVLNEEEGLSFRGLFILDKSGVVRHLLINDLPLGRSVDEALRTLQALQHVEKHGEVCPANWHEGEKAMKPNKKSVDEYLSA